MINETLQSQKTDLLEKLKGFTIILGRYPTKEEIDNSKITHHSFSYYKYFRTLNDAFKELNLELRLKCKVCNKEFISNQALAAHLWQKQDVKHLTYYKKLKIIKIKKTENYENICKICDKRFNTEKGLRDHIFSFNINDKKHLNLKNKLREKRFENAKIICPVCKRKLIRNIGNHLTRTHDKEHTNFYNKQKKLVLNLFDKKHSFSDMKEFDNLLLKGYSEKHFAKICFDHLGKEKVLCISRKIHSNKRKRYWNHISPAKRKKIMERVREAEWSRLNSEERRNHPWVLAGRKASLESSKRGSKNQKYAFKLLKQIFPNIHWKYNYTLDDGWHIDIAAPKKNLFIEWDGRHHFIPIHGYKYLNNRKNRDKIKNKIVTKKLNSCLVRIKDKGRANQKFVEEKVNRVSKILEQGIPTGKLIQL